MKALLFTLSLLFALPGFARVDLTREQLMDIKNANVLSKLRVYTNKKLITYWRDVELAQTDVENGNVSSAIEEEKLKVIVGKHVRGVVTRISHDFNQVYVSFDSDCLTADCSYVFDLRDGVYDLSDVPKRTGFIREAAKAGVILRADPLKRQVLKLQMNLSELRKIIKTTDRADGHN